MNENDPLRPKPPAAPSRRRPRPAGCRAGRRADLEARHAELSDAFLRAKAEAENTRRRAEEEMAKARKYAVEAFAESLLPVKDSLEAAIAIPAATPRAAARGRACHLAPAERGARAQQGRRDQPGRRPRASIRTSTRRSASCRAAQEPNTVVAVLQKGYLIADRVLRPALVTVSAAS